MILAILHYETPSRTSLLPPGASEIDVARAYGVQAGYEKALIDLCNLAEPLQQHTEPPVTFSEPEDEE